MALTKLNNKAVANVTSIPVALGDMVLVSSATASSSASIEFSLGSYKEYQFFFVNMHPQTDNVAFQFQTSTDGGSNYNVTKTTTAFGAYNYEGGGSYALNYDGSGDLAQGTGYQQLNDNGALGNGNDESLSGFLHLFSPSDTTFVKHFVGTVQYYETGNYSVNSFVAGYGNTTSAINAVDFKMSSGNIDAGTIQMFGIL